MFAILRALGMFVADLFKSQCRLELRKGRHACGQHHISLDPIELKSEKFVSGLLGWLVAEGNKQNGYEILHSFVRDDDTAVERRMLFHQVKGISHRLTKMTPQPADDPSYPEDQAVDSE